MDLISSVTINKLQTGVGEQKAEMGWVNLSNCVGHCSQLIMVVSPSDLQSFGDVGREICHCCTQPG